MGMQAGKILLWLPSVAFFLMSGVVAIRLLLLARRTRELPERLMGGGLLCMIFIFVPIMASTGMGRQPVGEVNIDLLAFGIVFLWGGLTAIIAFTWKTFRPTEVWAEALILFVSASTAGAACGMVGALYASPPDMASFEAGKLWTGLLRIPLICGVAWTGFEGTHAYRMARKRLALGLSDPVVTNRFLLWGIVGFAQVAIHSVSLLLHFMGIGMMVTPLGLFVVSIGSAVGSICMWLVFIPPAAYMRWVEGRSAAAPA
jgi:hypothetical protein